MDISVTVDRNAYSEEKRLFIYDSLCMDCNTSNPMDCTRKVKENIKKLLISHVFTDIYLIYNNY